MTTIEEVKARIAPRNAGWWCPPGWEDLVIQLHDELIEVIPDYQIGQVKQKFCGLRFYIEPIESNRFGEAYAIINKYKEMSFGICECCGKDFDRPENRGHMGLNLCPNCPEERYIDSYDY